MKCAQPFVPFEVACEDKVGGTGPRGWPHTSISVDSGSQLNTTTSRFLVRCRSDFILYKVDGFGIVLSIANDSTRVKLQ